MKDKDFNLKSFRETIGWTQAQLAEKLEVSQSTVNSWEDKPGNIPIQTLFNIAEVSGYKVSDLLAYEDKTVIKPLDYKPDEQIRKERQGIQQKLEKMKERLLSKQADSKKYREYQTAIHQFLTILESALQKNQKLNVSFLGKSDSGKSTLINSILGAEVSPTQWQPATSATLKIVHTSDKPRNFEEADVLVLASNEKEGMVLASQLKDEGFLKENLLAEGDFSLISQYGLSDGEKGRDEEEYLTIFAFVNAPVLELINIIDTPGIATGEHIQGKKDTLASEQVRNESDAIVYLSVANQFLQSEDQAYLKAILDILPVLEDQPLSNLFIVASQAHITSQEELVKEEGIFDKAFERFNKVLPEGYLESKGYTEEDLRARFFLFSRDSKDLSIEFRNSLLSFINDSSKQIVHSVNQQYTESMKKYREVNEEASKNLRAQAEDLGDIEAEIDRMEKTKEAYDEEVDHFIQDTQTEIKKLDDASQKEFKDAFHQVIDVDHIVEQVDKKDYKNRKKDKEDLQNLLSNELNEHFKKILLKHSETFNQMMDDKIEEVDAHFPHLHFDFKRAFISSVAGLTAGGALVGYMSTLGNLGGYILVTKIVGWLSSLGISVGGGAAATTVINALGGPIVLAVGLTLITAAGVFSLSGAGWKTRFAKEIVKVYEKEKVLDEFSEQIENYWQETSDAVLQTEAGMKKEYDQQLKDLQEKARQSPDYFYKSAYLIENLIAEAEQSLSKVV